MIWLCILIVSLVFILYHKLSQSELSEAAKQFNGPKAYPILGNSLDFASNTNAIFKTVLRLTKKYGRFMRVWNNGELFLFISKAQDLEVIASSNDNITKSDLYRFLIPWIGYGLLTSTGTKWKKHRRIITPTFHFKILESFFDIFNKNNQIFIKKLEDELKNGVFNLYPYISTLALDNISETAMGVEMHIQENKDSTYLKAIKTICHTAGLRLFKVWLMPDFLFNLSQYSKLQSNALKIIHGTAYSLIKQKRKELQENSQTAATDPENDWNQKKRMAFLDLLLQSAEGSQLSDEDIREEVDTFMFEGHDTVSSVLSFLLYEVANHPTVQEKIYEEQKEIFGDSDRIPTYKDIQDMKYLEQAVKEALRLYPSVPFIGRQVEKACEFPGGYKIPKNTNVIINLYSLHRDPEFFPNPEEFDPDNFSPEKIVGRHPYAYAPFSAGPRNCIGQKYAILEMKTIVSTMLRKYKLKGSSKEKDKVTLASELVLISTNGYNIEIERRE